MNRAKKLFIFSIFLALTFPLQLVGILMSNEGISGKERGLYPGIKSSTLIVEDEDDFLVGTMDNLTLDGSGNLRLDNDIRIYWINMNPSTKPSARRWHSMVYDSAHDKVILFGGDDGSHDDETWVYNLTDNTWTNMNPSTKPSARASHSMVYDSAHDKVILFGGYDGGGWDDETWVYNLTDNTWTNMNPSTKPSARDSHSMVYDSADDKVILFGGYDAIGRNDETWVYNLTDNSWTNMNTSHNPGARFIHSMAYNSAHDKVILFGGYDDDASDDETWVYNLTDNSWTNMNPSTSPSERRRHSMVYDSARDKVILFGGYDNTVSDNEMWAYNLTENSWINMNPSTKPSERYESSMVYDSTHDKVILFGGYDAIGRDDETWVYSVDKFFQQGIFTSKVKSFDFISTITGEISWTPVGQPTGTFLKIQIGLSYTQYEAHFNYTTLHNKSFAFDGIGQYMKYRVVFESDLIQNTSPLLNKINISHALESICSDDDDEIILGNVIVGIISSVATVGIIGIVLYSKNKIGRT